MLKNLTIKTRLLASVALLSCIMLAIGGAGTAGLELGNGAQQRAYHERLEALGRLDGVTHAMQRNQLAMARAITDDPARLPATIGAVTRDRALADRLWAEYSAAQSTAEGQAMAARFSSARSSYLAEGLDPALTAAAAGSTARVQELLHGSLGETFEEAMRMMDGLQQMQRRAAQAEFLQAQERNAAFRSAVQKLLLGGLVLATVLGTWLVRSITTPLNRAARFAQGVAGGNLGQRMEASAGHDETSRLLAALHELNRNFAATVGDVRTASGSMANAASGAVHGTVPAAAVQEQAALLSRAVDGFRLEALAPGEEGYEAPVISLAARAREERARHARALSRTA